MPTASLADSWLVPLLCLLLPSQLNFANLFILFVVHSFHKYFVKVLEIQQETSPWHSRNTIIIASTYEEFTPPQVTIPIIKMRNDVSGHLGGD